MGEKEKDYSEALEIMRLLLLAKLVEVTGIVWDVQLEVCLWDYHFNCRYGSARWDSLQTRSMDFAKNPLGEMIKSKMNQPAKEIASSFMHRRRTICPTCHSSLTEKKPFHWYCNWCEIQESMIDGRLNRAER